MHTLSPKVFIGGTGAGDHKQSFLFVLAYVFRMSHFQVLNDELQSFFSQAYLDLRQSNSI